MAGSTKRVQNAHCFARRMWSAQKNVSIGCGSRWEDRKQTDKLKKLSTYRKGFGNGNNESYSPKYFILHLKEKDCSMDGKGTAPQETLETLYEGASHTPTHAQAKSLCHLPTVEVIWPYIPGQCPEAVRALRIWPKGTATQKPQNSWI